MSFNKNNKFKTHQILFQFGQFRMIAFKPRLITISFLQWNLACFNFHLFQLKYLRHWIKLQYLHPYKQHEMQWLPISGKILRLDMHIKIKLVLKYRCAVGKKWLWFGFAKKLRFSVRFYKINCGFELLVVQFGFLHCVLFNVHALYWVQLSRFRITFVCQRHLSFMRLWYDARNDVMKQQFPSICIQHENKLMHTSSLLSSNSFSTWLIACCFSSVHFTQVNNQIYDNCYIY